MECPICGRSIPNNCNICPVCGSPVNKPAETNTAVNKQPAHAALMLGLISTISWQFPLAGLLTSTLGVSYCIVGKRASRRITRIAFFLCCLSFTATVLNIITAILMN